jgi:hypothetical protein
MWQSASAVEYQRVVIDNDNQLKQFDPFIQA